MIHISFDKLKIDKRSSQPISLQLVQSIKLLIMNNEITYKFKLPLIAEISKELNIRKSDVEKAYQALIDEKYLVKKNNEYLINFFHFSANFFLDVVPLFDAIKLMGMTPSLKTISKKREKLPNDLKILSKKNDDEKYICIKRVYYGNEIPLVVLESFLPEKKFPNLDKILEDNEPLYEALYSRFQTRITSSDRLFKVVNLDKDLASYLNTMPGSASYQGLSLAYDYQHELIDISRSWSIINYYFDIEYTRSDIEKIMNNHLFFI